MDANVFDSNFTPEIGNLPTQGSQKLLVAIFVVDASRSMENGRIGAVNNALKELKYKLSEIQIDNNLDLKVAIMSFTSSARWEVELTPIEELNFNGIQTRAGLTQYGTVFHELNKVLTKDNFMKHTGKIAPPAIMFLTDGEPDDDYNYDLDQLLKNAWFTNASRSAVLIGDAIYNDSARKAVARFVNSEADDIVAAEDSTMIIQKIQIATLHTIQGNPLVDPQGIGDVPAPIPQPQPSPDPDPFGGTSGQDNPFGGTSGQDNPFGGTSGQDDPFGGTSGQDDPFGGTSGQDDPFGGTSGQDDPFGGTSGQDDPFGGTSGQGDPFAGNPFDN